MRELGFILLFLVVTLSEVKAFDRCDSYTQEVRKAHFKVFGLNYPYWYGVAQLKQESNCRDVISRDGIGSQGLAQITYRWWQKYLKTKGINDIKSISNQLLAQAYIMQNASYQNPYKSLWINYQIYNGGNHVVKELKRANSTKWEDGLKVCDRGYTTFSNGTKKSNCEINYDYSKKVYQYGQKWKIGNDVKGFWK